MRRIARTALLGAGFAVLCCTPSRADGPRTSGLHELVVLDPGVNETGLPEIQLKAGRVVTPSHIHVHRYFYNGDKEYQGPFGLGGPTVVVANHPRTGNRVYIDVNLPSGAPVIGYTEHDITYTYPTRKVIIKFLRWHKDGVSVKYTKGPGLPKTGAAKQHSRLSFAVHEQVKNAGKTLLGGAGMVRDLAATGVEKVGELADNLPGVKALRSAFEQRSQQQIETLRQQGIKQAREADRFIRTNR